MAKPEGRARNLLPKAEVERLENNLKPEMEDLFPGRASSPVQLSPVKSSKGDDADERSLPNQPETSEAPMNRAGTPVKMNGGLNKKNSDSGFSPRTSKMLALETMRSNLSDSLHTAPIAPSRGAITGGRSTVIINETEGKKTFKQWLNNHLVLAAAAIISTSIVGGVIIFLVFSASINTSTIEDAESVVKAFLSLTEPDPSQTYSLLNVLVVINSTILILALEVSAIVLQIAAARFSSQVVTFFFQSPRPISLLFFFLFNMVYLVVLASTCGTEAPMRSEAIFVTLLTLIATLMLFPYFIDTFQITTAETIIQKLGDMAIRATRPKVNVQLSDVKQNTSKVSNALERLANMALNAVQQSDKIYAYHVGNELCECVLKYGAHKWNLPPEWKSMPLWNRDNPDFFSLDQDGLQQMVADHSWLEWKVLRQYQMIYDQAIRNRSYGVTCLIAVNTRKICENAATLGDGATVDLCVKFFNTFLRYAISADDGRSCGNVLHQYRQVGEFLLYHTDNLKWHDEGEEDGREDRAVMVAKYMAYYAEMALKRDLGPVTELCAHDLSTLCQLAYLMESPLHERLLSTFLCVDDVASALQIETAVMGIRKAQMKLATTYMENGDDDLARQIQMDMAEDPPDRLAIVRRQLTEFNEKEFWEVGERGTNVDYLKPAQQEELMTFFEWFGDGFFDDNNSDRQSFVESRDKADRPDKQDSSNGDAGEGEGPQERVKKEDSESTISTDGKGPVDRPPPLVYTQIDRKSRYNEKYILNRGTSIIMPSSQRSSMAQIEPVASDGCTNNTPAGRRASIRRNSVAIRRSRLQSIDQSQPHAPVVFL